MVAELRPQPDLLAARVPFERLVDELINRPLDSPLEQVSRLGARSVSSAIRRSNISAREPSCSSGSSIARDSKRAACAISPRRLAPAGPTRSAAAALTLFGRQLAQARQEWSESFPPAGADREQLDLTSPSRSRSAERMNSTATSRSALVEVVDLVDHQAAAAGRARRPPETARARPPTAAGSRRARRAPRRPGGGTRGRPPCCESESSRSPGCRPARARLAAGRGRARRAPALRPGG